MKKQIFKFVLVIISLVILSKPILAQNVVVSGASVGNGSYSNLFNAINAIAGASGSISVSIINGFNSNITTTINPSGWSKLTIFPSGGTPKYISGNINGPLIKINGASNVVIDGLNSGGNTLEFDNLSTSTIACVIDIVGSASNNTITNCSLNSDGNDANIGVVTFESPISPGFSNNSVSTCTLGGYNSSPRFGILVANSTSYNGSNSITNCTFTKFYSTTPNQLTAAIFIKAHINWLIDGNNIHFPLSGFSTGISGRGYGIYISTVSTGQFTITNNYIGNTNSLRNAPANLSAQIFHPIEINVANGNNSIQGNTITAINLFPTAAVGGSGNFCAIGVFGGGNFSIGNIAPNIIGGATGTSSITVVNTSTNSSFDLNLTGIYSPNSIGSLVIQNNIIGALSCYNTFSTSTSLIDCIRCDGNNNGSVQIINNIIGNTTPNNIAAGLISSVSSGSTSVSGIEFYPPAFNLSSISGNTIQNLSSMYTNTYSVIRGIACSSKSVSINSNFITNLRTYGQGDVIGLFSRQNNTTSINSNTITNISITGTNSNLSSNAYAIYAYSLTFNNVISKNVIYNITNAGISTSPAFQPKIAGIVLGTRDQSSPISPTLEVSNNFVSLGNSFAGNAQIEGVKIENNCPISKIYHNTINIEGTVASGSLSTHGLHRSGSTSTIDVRNNIITNTRNGGTGFHYAISENFGNAASSTGWGSNASNYNVLNANPATIGYWNSNRTFTTWKTASASDANSFSNITVNYLNSANNLHLNMGLISTPIESGAQAVPSVITDIDNQNRPGPLGSTNGGALTSDIGADEFDGVLPDITPPVITYTNLPTICGVADRTLTATLTDFSGVPTSGILQPRIYFRKNVAAYTSSTGTLTAGTSTNGTWNFVISMSALGGVNNGDLISYYLIAQDEYTNSINIGSNPALGLVAVNVNSVTTNPIIASQTFVINFTPTVSVNSGSICAGNTFVIVPSGASSYTYSSGTATVNPNLTTTYSITGTSSVGCVSGNTAIATISVAPLPTLSVNSGSFCLGSPFVIVPTGASTYTISGGTATVSPANTSSYSVSGTSSVGCLSSNTVIATASMVPLPTLSVNSGSICSGGSFVIVPTGALTYTFSGGSATVSPLVTNSYSVSGTSSLGCVSASVAISTVSVSPSPTLTVNSGSICSGNAFVIVPSGANTYSYSGGSATVNPNTTTSYSVTGTSSVGCAGTNTAISTVSVNPLPQLTVAGPSLICVGEIATLNANGANSYSWSNGGNLNSINVNPIVSTGYSVTGTDANGCSKTIVAALTVDPCTSIKNVSSKDLDLSFQIYPNPNNGEFTIETTKETDITITNTLGQLILQRHLEEGKNKLDLNEQAKGIYFMQFGEKTKILVKE